MRGRWTFAVCVVALVAVGCDGRSPEPNRDGAPSAAIAPAAAVDPLPSWNDGVAKTAISAFVARATAAGGADFVPAPERIAVFDNDGTLWAEQPIYVQLAFALDRVRALAPQHPEWSEREPFKSVLAGDVQRALATGERGIVELLAATHAGNTTEEFESVVRQWIATARHPRFDRPYTEIVYQPMLELLEYLRANGFKTFIVSGGGVDFMRPWVEMVYGIPPEQVVGSRVKLDYEVRDGVPRIARLAGVDFVDDKAGKPIGIQQVIGRRPIAAFGNSDGDFEMLEWTTAGAGARLGVIVRHTDGAREWAYDRDSHVGTLARALDEAPARGWIVVDMKEDWNVVYPSAEAASARVSVQRYAGFLPCAGCSAIHADLRLFAESASDQPTRYELTETYVGTRDGVRTFERSGLWGVLRGTPADADAIVYQLDIGDPERARSFVLTKDGELRQLDRQHNEIVSPAPHSLHRQSAARDASIVTITADDAGQRVVVEVGQALVVKLDGNRSTGYRWTRSSSEGGVLLSLGGADAFHEPAGAERALGASRDESWWFAVASPGSQQLTFQYRRPWESDAPSARRVAYVIDATASRR